MGQASNEAPSLMLVVRLWLLEGTSLDSSLVSLLAGGRVCAAVGEGK